MSGLICIFALAMKHLANITTTLNLIAGFSGIILFLDNQFLMAIIALLAAAVFDFVDGFIARLLKTQGEFGKQLDSLCDMVTFGVFPGLVAFVVLRIESSAQFGFELSALYALPAFLIPLFAALRLAKFNISDDQKYSFKGLPTPAMALFIIPLLLHPEYLWLPNNYYLMVTIVIASASMMVLPIPLIALKFKSKKLTDNWPVFLLIVHGAAFIPFFGLWSGGVIIPFYILFSITHFALKSIKIKKS